jgi:hypothetical protein
MGITDALKEITPANGYINDLSDKTTGHLTDACVFRGRDLFGDNDPVPMLSILESPTPPEGLAAPMGAVVGQYSLDLLVQGFAQDDKQNPTDPAHVLMADVKQRLGKELSRKRGNQHDPFGMGVSTGTANIITSLKIGPGLVRPPDSLSAKAYFWLTLSVGLAENVELPYA